MADRPLPIADTPIASAEPIAPAGEGARLKRVSLAALALLAILAVAAAFRLPALDRIPPGFQFDEAYNAIDAWRVAQGARDIFFPANGGREPLLSYWQALFLAVWGPNVAALRLASAVVGLLTLVVTWAAFTRIFAARRDALRLGVLAAGAMAVTYWGVHFSRYSIRAILVPLVMALVFWLYFEGTGQRAPRALPLLGAGIALAASIYAHPTGRLLPFALAAYTVWLMWADRRRWVGYLLSLAIVGVVSFVLFLPLGVYFLDHRYLFFGHPSDVAVVGQAAESASSGPLGQVLAVLGMFFIRGDTSQFHNLPGRPAFDPLMAVFFVLGIVMLMWAGSRARGLSRGPYVLILLWAIVALLPTLLSDGAPNFSRAIGILPVLGLVVAAGLSAAMDWILSPHPPAPSPTRGERGQAGWRRVAAYALPVIVLAVSAAWTARDYFVVWASQPALYYAYDIDKEDAARQVISWQQETNHVYLAPLWAGQSTIAFLTRDNPPTGIEFERGAVVPAADGKDAVYAYTPDQERRYRRLTTWLNDAAAKSTVNGQQDQPLLTVVRLPSAARPTIGANGITWAAVRPTTPLNATWTNGPQLLGYSYDTTTHPGDTIRMPLFWRAPAPLDTDLTLFAHLVDANGKTVLQDDHTPLNTSYPTSRWAPDEVIIDLALFSLPDSLPLGDYKLQVGWYDLATGERRMLADGSGNEFTAATFKVGAK
ncbi:MAG: glycosyltransferase family 39 protein [Anaerolineae bacterium]